MYIHRCGRTARIGREGEVLALLSPEDEKAFRAIRRVVLGTATEETLEPYPVSYVQLSKLEPLVEAAQKIESALHRNDKEKKSANWLLKAAQDADLTLDDNLKVQIAETLGADRVGGKRKKKEKDEVIAPIDMIEDDKQERFSAGHKRKELSKVQQYKQRYEELKKNEQFKRFSNSSYLTPEAASYLNELIHSNQSKADLEIVYAG